MCVIRDVTDQNSQLAENIELEKKLQRAQRLESLGVLAGAGSYVRKPFTIIEIGNAVREELDDYSVKLS